MKTLAVDTPLGHLAWGSGPESPTSSRRRSSVASGLRRPGTSYPINFVICENSNDPNVPMAATLTAYS